MYIIAILFTVLFGAGTIQAQNPTEQTGTGSLYELAVLGKAYFEADFSNASIHNMSEELFAEYETDWYKDKPQITSLFMSNFSERTKELLTFVTKENAKYTMRWVVGYISQNGYIRSELHIVDKNGNILEKITDITGEGGSFGSKLNLIKDGTRNCGSRAGYLLKKVLKKELKRHKKSVTKQGKKQEYQMQERDKAVYNKSVKHNDFTDIDTSLDTPYEY